MLFSDLQELFQAVTVEILCGHPELFQAGGAVRVRKQGDGTDAYLSNGGVVQDTGKFATRSYADSWAGIQSQAYLAQVAEVRGNRLVVTAVTGFFLRHYNKVLEIAVTDAAVKSGRAKSFDAVKRHIESNYVLPFGGKTYIVAAKHIESRGNTLSIVNGARTYAVAGMARRACGAADGPGASEDIFAITQGEAPFRKEDYSMELWACGLKVCDATSAGRTSAEVKAYTGMGLARYLALWRKYALVEFDFIQRTGERAGSLAYSVLERSGCEAVLRLQNPAYRKNFLERLGELGTDWAVILPRKEEEGRRRRNPAVLSGTLIPAGEKDQAIVRFRDEEACYAIAPGGVILPDLRAAQMQYERREEAFSRIAQGRSAKPQLALLISGEGAARQPEKRHMTPLSEAVIQKCFPEHPPTDSQRRAIAMALNTPDFAIIQGPPGTGKTTVINAIMMALSEKEKDPELFFGKNLLTAYQKDATAHLAEKLEIYGLPVITYKGSFSRRSDGGNFSGPEEDGDAAVSAWVRKKREALTASDVRAAQFAEMDALVGRLKLLRVSFDTETASREACRSLLLAYREELLSLREGGAAWLAERCLPPAEALLACVEAEIQGDGASQARLHLDRLAADGLPVSPVSMEDGGPETVRKVLRRFSGQQYAGEIQRICQALEREYGTEPVAYRRVKILKNRLLSELREKSGLLSNNRLNEKAAAALEEAVQAVERSERSDEERIMAEYVGAFSDEEGIRESVKEFLTVISATHQKAVSRDIQKMKGGEDVVFENVLIDEAARSCPPDLLIPLSCARDRMILVGDHRQLPQFVSDKVYNALDAAEEGEKQAIIKGSMFLHLIEQVKKLERVDGVKRFVQLDAQFRMPGTLGKLVSECFYEGKLDSPRGNEGFDTGLKYIQNYHLAWLDVPGRAGAREVKNKNGSYQRPAEAERIVKMLHSVIRDSGELGKRYKYGIMAFYNGQKELLEQLLDENHFLRELREDGVRIDTGTVDAFQGMEYDVVFLSLVRSNTDYTSQKKRYGFTTDERRLCVALSRAQRCMIVAGDSQMMQGEAARDAVPALVKFYQLCRNKEVPDAGFFKDKDFLYQKAES